MVLIEDKYLQKDLFNSIDSIIDVSRVIKNPNIKMLNAKAIFY